jgi:uncharacterized membrane protein
MANENARDEESQMQESGSESGSNGSGSSSLINKSNLIPAAATALAAAGAGLAVTKGPDLMRKLSGNAEGQAEELGRKGAEGAKEALSQGKAGMLGKAASKLMGGGGGTGKGGKTRRLPIQRWTDVAVPVEEAYEKWTNYEEFPKFMHRVLEVKQEEEGKVHWQEKIWFSTREWDGEIVEERKNDRIAWKTASGTQHSGVISFHRLDKNLTRVLVTVDFVPTGMIEKMASGMRFVKRAVQSDLARFKAYAELGEVDGLEYSSKPEEMEQHQGEDADSDSGAENSATEEDSAQDDEERESKREERESRRSERRGSVASS